MAFGEFTYLVYMAAFSWLPVGILWIKYHSYLKKHLKTIGKTFAMTFPLVMSWDIIAVFNRAWQYSPEMTLNVNLFFMPIEEFMLIGSSIFGVSCITILFYEYLRKHNKVR